MHSDLARVSSVGEARVRLDPAMLRIAVVGHREPIRAELLLVLQEHHISIVTHEM